MESTSPSLEEAELFGAFRAAPRTRRWAWLVLGAGLFAAVGLVALVISAHNRIPVMTPYGVRAISRGMPPAEVSAVLGRPVGSERVDAHRECLRYARPARKESTVAVYTVCFNDGRLVDVTEKPFGIWRLRKDGTLGPMFEKKSQLDAERAADGLPPLP